MNELFAFMEEMDAQSAVWDGELTLFINEIPWVSTEFKRDSQTFKTWDLLEEALQGIHYFNVQLLDE